MILTASVEMSKADLDKLTDADLRWLENEVSRRLKERLELAFEIDTQSSGSANACRECKGKGTNHCFRCERCYGTGIEPLQAGGGSYGG